MMTKQGYTPKRILSASAVLAMFLIGCSSAKITEQHEMQPVSTRPANHPPAIIYVQDFDLDTQNIQGETGLAGRMPHVPRPLGILPKRPGAPKDPDELARDLVDTMSKSLVSDLQKAGYQVQRLRPGDPLPAQGWIVRGVFAQVSEGNRLRRAMIGFGQGKTDMQVVVHVDNLAQGQLSPLYEVSTEAQSGKMPGAVVTLNPYMAVAKLALSSHDLDRNVKQTAKQISGSVVQRVEGTAPSRVASAPTE